MQGKDFEDIVDAAFSLGFQAGNFGSKYHDAKEMKKAKRKLLKLQGRHLISNAADKRKLCKVCGGNLIDGICYDCLGDGGCR